MFFLGNREQAMDFVNWLNSIEPGISFTFEWSDKTINFLDVKLILENGKIKTDLFVKETNPQLYLHFNSNHPAHVFKAIPYGQAIRIQTICSEPEFVRNQLVNLKEKLVARGYPEILIDQQFNEAAKIERADLLKPKVYPHGASPVPVNANKPKFKPEFIFTYNPHNPPVRKWVQQFHHILLSDPKMRQVRPNLPSIVFR